jgi:hypothetical protein
MMMPANCLEAGLGLTPGGVVLDLCGEINGFAKEALNAACAEAEAKNPETILLNFVRPGCPLVVHPLILLRACRRITPLW